MPEKSEKLAYILGAMYGDGCFAHKDQNGRVHFGASDKEFVKKVVNDVNLIFNLNLKIRVDRLSEKSNKWRDLYSFSSRRLYKHIAESDFKVTRLLPDFITNGTETIKASFIGGFFDAEGNVNIQKTKRKEGNVEVQRHISGFSNDIELLKQVKSLLSDLGIKSNISHNKNKTYYVSIWNYRSLKIFHDIVGFRIKRKMRTLEIALESYKLIQTRWDYKTYNMVINLREEGLGARKIKENLSRSNIEISIPTIESWIYKNNKPLKNEVT